MSKIKFISGYQLAYIATTSAIAISREFDLEDINILSSIFCAIGDTLAIIASQQVAIQSVQNEKEPSGSEETPEEQGGTAPGPTSSIT